MVQSKQAEGYGLEKISIYHTNDIHSHLMNWPRTAKFLRDVRSFHENQKEEVLIFDIGDACDRVHPLTEATNGQAIIRLLNDAHYDAVTIGNNEGIGSTKYQLNQLYNDADFKIILSNLTDKDTNALPNWAVPIKIYKTSSGSKLGIFACTIPLTVSYDPLGWNVEDPFKTIERILEQYEGIVDNWILLSHLGIDYDRKIAEKFPELNVIIGAHTHHLLPEGEYVNSSLLAGAGKFGEYIGQINIEIENQKIVKASAEVIDIEKAIKPVKDENILVHQYTQLGHELLQEQKIADIPDTLEADWKQCTNFVNIGLDALCNYAETDAAILNSGLFLQPIIEGSVTNDDLHRALPHPMRVLKYTVTGKQLKELIYSMETQRARLEPLPIKGLGFRGKIFGKICYKGIQVTENQEIKFNGKSIREEADYTIASVDHYLFVPFFPIIGEKSDYQVLFPHFLRVVIGNYLQKQYPIK